MHLEIVIQELENVFNACLIQQEITAIIAKMAFMEVLSYRIVDVSELQIISNRQKILKLNFDSLRL